MATIRGAQGVPGPTVTRADAHQSHTDLYAHDAKILYTNTLARFIYRGSETPVGDCYETLKSVRCSNFSMILKRSRFRVLILLPLLRCPYAQAIENLRVAHGVVDDVRNNTFLRTKPRYSPTKQCEPGWMRPFDGCSLREDGTPSASVAVVVEGGRISYAAAFGDAKLHPKTAALETTRYQLASISKTFTAQAVLLLEADGKLSLDDKVSKVVSKSNWCVRYYPPRASEPHFRVAGSLSADVPGWCKK